MAEYHVGAGLFGIYCGTLNKPLKDGSITWRNKTECTDRDVVYEGREGTPKE